MRASSMAPSSAAPESIVGTTIRAVSARAGTDAGTSPTGVSAISVRASSPDGGCTIDVSPTPNSGPSPSPHPDGPLRYDPRAFAGAARDRKNDNPGTRPGSSPPHHLAVSTPNRHHIDGRPRSGNRQTQDQATRRAAART